MSKVNIINHAVAENSLTILRDKTTSLEDFRKHSLIISKILLTEALKNLNLGQKDIETPLTSFSGSELSDKVIAVPVLRAGLAMFFALQELLPSVRVGFIGLERDEKTGVAREYYRKFPKISGGEKFLILDPMLATGGSLESTIKLLKELGAKEIIVASIISAPEGLEKIENAYPDVTIYTTAVDEKLDEKKYIVPGLGDFGDRYFGTDIQ